MTRSVDWSARAVVDAVVRAIVDNNSSGFVSFMMKSLYLKMVMNGEVNRVFITYRDRLTRFGFHYLETMFNEQGVEIIVVKQKIEDSSVERELMTDMMSLIASFSGKLYGMRSKGERSRKIEHYLELIDRAKQEVELVDGLKLEDLME